MAPFDECPACDRDGDWADEGVCVSCGYDVLEDSDEVEDAECAFCGGELVDDDGGLSCPDCEDEE